MRGKDTSLYRSGTGRGMAGDMSACFVLAVSSLTSLFFDASRKRAVDLYIAFNSNFEADF